MFIEPVPPELILWDVIEDHHAEANFHFEIWERGLSSPVLVINQVRSGLEARLEQHVVGFLTAGEAGAERLLYPELEEMTSPLRTTLAAVMTLRLSQRSTLDELLDFLFVSHDDAQRRALVRGISLHDEPRLELVLREAFERARSPREKAMLLEVFAALHLDPGETLGDCFDMGFAVLDAAAVRAAGRSGRHDLLSMVERFIDADDPELRRNTIEAALLLGSRAAWSRCRMLAATKNRLAPWAMHVVSMLGTPDDHALIHAHLDGEDESMRQAALWALGFTGRIQSAELCLQHLESDNERTAKLAAEAFGEITGLSRLTLELFTTKPKEEVAEAGENEPLSLDEDDLDADLVPDATDELPLLDPFAVASWYERNRHRFSRKRRYIAGKIFNPTALIGALITFPMRRRHGLALELAFRTGARRWVTTDAFYRRQARELRGLSDLNDKDIIRRFDSE